MEHLASGEALVILSNFGVAITTLLLFFASIREQHETIRQITKANNRLIRRLFGVVMKKNKDAKHRKGSQ